VAAINADIGSFVTARNVGGHLVLRSNSSGQSATMALQDGAGAPLAALGLATTGTRNGQVPGVAVAVQGKYGGSDNGRLVFVPDGDGTIGLTPGLTVSVFDDSGRKIATLDVGQGSYVPGDPIDVVDGVQVSFGPGTLSASFGDVFALDTLADSDTTDVLVALGLNSFFHGSTAADLTVNPALESNADLLAAGLSGAAGDADNLTRMLGLRDTKLSALNSSSLEDYYSDLIGNVGFESATAEATLKAQAQLLAHLEHQRAAVSGVNLDEEMVNMVQYQQAFEAASRFINVINDITSILINLGR
jgi:flagellar hook-associated protein 1